MDEFFKGLIDAVKNGDYGLVVVLVVCASLFYVFPTLNKRLSNAHAETADKDPHAKESKIDSKQSEERHSEGVVAPFHDFGNTPRPLTSVPIPGNELWANAETLSKLTMMSGNTRVVLLWGPSGQGKTTQAAFFAEEALRTTHCFVIWLDCKRGVESALSSLRFEGLPPSLSWREGCNRLSAFLSSLEGTNNRALIILDSVDSQSSIEGLHSSNALRALYSMGSSVDILAVAHSASQDLTRIQLPPLDCIKVKELVKSGLGVELLDAEAEEFTASVAGNPLVCDLAVGMVAAELAESIHEIKDEISTHPSVASPQGEALRRPEEEKALVAIRIMLKMAVQRNGVEHVLALGQRYLRSGIDYERFVEAVDRWATEDDINLLVRAKWLVLLGGGEDEEACLIAMHTLVAEACMDEGIIPTLDDESLFLDALYNSFLGSKKSRSSTVRVADVFRTARLDVSRDEQDEGTLQWLWIVANRETALRRRIWSYEQEIDARSAMARMLRGMKSANVVPRPASMSLYNRSGSEEWLPKHFAEVENDLQRGFALRRMGKLSDAASVLRNALSKTRWIESNNKISSCGNDTYDQEEADLATKILASYGYTRALSATQADPRHVNWDMYREAVTYTRHSMGLAAPDTGGYALSHHYAAMVEYLLAWEALTGKASDVSAASGRLAKELLEDSIIHEDSCARTLAEKRSKKRPSALGTVPQMDHEACLGRSQALLAELEGNTEVADGRRRNALRLLRSSVALTEKERGQYSLDMAVRSLDLTHARIALAVSYNRTGNNAIAAATIDDAKESAEAALLAFRANGDNDHAEEAKRIHELIASCREDNWESVILELENDYRRSLELDSL